MCTVLPSISRFHNGWTSWLFMFRATLSFHIIHVRRLPFTECTTGSLWLLTFPKYPKCYGRRRTKLSNCWLSWKRALQTVLKIEWHTVISVWISNIDILKWTKVQCSLVDYSFKIDSCILPDRFHICHVRYEHFLKTFQLSTQIIPNRYKTNAQKLARKKNYFHRHDFHKSQVNKKISDTKISKSWQGF